MQTKAKLILSDSYNPYNNLALEEYLLERVKEDEVILYLWQNQNTIVIGKNQNPWRECHISQAEDEPLIARRLSGGGAVYHDLGNLNFTFIMRNEHYNLEKQLLTILETLKNLGINAEFTGDNDITVGEKGKQKVSGNAFYFTDKSSYHHGTLLVNTDLNFLDNYLQVSKEKLKSKGINSVKSRVVNIKDLNPAVTIEKAKKEFIDSFAKIYGETSSVELIQGPEKDLYKDKINKYSSWDWIFGQSPKFNMQIEKRFDFGNLEILFYLKDSIIEDITIYTDSVITSIIGELTNKLIGLRFNSKDLIQALDAININSKREEDIIMQIKAWFKRTII